MNSNDSFVRGSELFFIISLVLMMASLFGVFEEVANRI